jgi:hypothetical protein
MNRTKTRLILGAVLGILGLAWTVLGAAPGFAAGVGNECSGKFLFKMNIIGVDNPKTAPMTNPSRKTIFVNLGASGSPKESNIFLTQGPFTVCDGNSWLPAVGCDGTPLGNNLVGAVFQLPCNLNVQTTVACTGFSACYSVFFRALGKPGGGTTITTCGVDALGDTICSSNNTGLISRNKGKPKFTDVTNALTSLVCPPGTTDCTAGQVLPLFNSDFQNFLWQYDNQGLKNGMVVFCGANCGP